MLDGYGFISTILASQTCAGQDFALIRVGILCQGSAQNECGFGFLAGLIGYGSPRSCMEEGGGDSNPVR